MAAMALTILGMSPAGASADGCGGTPIAVAETERDANIVGKYTYYLRLKSELYRCDGYVHAHHYVYLDGSRMPLGTTVRVFVSTRRSDGKWHGGTTTMASSQNVSAQGFKQVRGVGGGLSVTHVRVGHFAEPGQTMITPSSTKTARYVPWNGPEASPRR
jgi:hypothetical protein